MGQLETAMQPALTEVRVEWDVPVDATVNPPSNVAGALGSLLSFKKPPPPTRVYADAPFQVWRAVDDRRTCDGRRCRRS